MDWHLNIPAPTAPKKLKAALEAARDEWIKTTPQETDTDAEDMLALVYNSHNEKRAPVVAMRAKMIADHSANLDATHTGIVAQMNRAIAAAVLAVNGGTVPVRARLAGHFKTVATDGIYQRVSVMIDDAAHQLPPDAEATLMADPPVKK